jgi:hypothetical protein
MTRTRLHEGISLLDQIRTVERWISYLQSEIERIKDFSENAGLLKNINKEDLCLIPHQVYKEVCKMVLAQHEVNLIELKDRLDKL